MAAKKKSVLFFVLFVLLLAASYVLSNMFSFSFFAGLYGGRYQAFVKEQHLADDKYAGMFYLTNTLTIQNEKDVVGEMITFNKGGITLYEIKNFFNAKFVGVETVQNVKIYYFYSNLLAKVIKTGKKTFNLQVIVDIDCVKVCYPINFAGF